MINHLCNDSLFGRQRCQNHRPGSPQRRVQKPEVLHRPTPVTPYCDGDLHRTPDRRPAAKIRMRNAPPQPASQTIRTIRSRRGAECCRQPLPKEWSQRDDRGFRRGGVCGTDRPSEHPLSTPPEDSACGPDNPFGDSLPPPQKYRLRDKPAFRTSTANPPEDSASEADRPFGHSLPPPRNTVCETSPPSEHPPFSEKIAHAGRTGAPNIRRPAEERHSGPSAARRNYDCTTPKTTKIPPARKEWSKRIQSEKLFVFLREN